MSKERQFYELLHTLRRGYQSGIHTYGACSNLCGNSARGGGLCVDCCTAEIGILIDDTDIAESIQNHTNLAAVFIGEALNVLEESK